MNNKYDERVKDLIKKGYNLELISFEFEIPIKQLETYKKQIMQEKQAIKQDSINNDVTRKKIENMIIKYNILFKTEKNKPKPKEEQNELSEEEIDQLVQKIEGIIDRVNRKNSSNLRVIIRTYIRQLEDAIGRKVEKTIDIEELESLSKKVTTKICKESVIGTSGIKSLIQSKISKIKQQEFVERLRKDIPKEIEHIIEGLADGTLDIDMANRAINCEAKRRVEKSPKSKFSLTEERHRAQIFMQINTVLRENGQKYPIRDLKATTEKLVQLEKIGQLQVAEIAVRNAISRKEFATAKAICSIFGSRVKNEEAKQLNMLRNQVKIAEMSEIANKMLTGCKSYEEQEQCYILLESAMKAENIKTSQIPIGKNESGATIYLGKIWDDEKQR